jgi:hypothetical protein
MQKGIIFIIGSETGMMKNFCELMNPIIPSKPNILYNSNSIHQCRCSKNVIHDNMYKVVSYG